MCLRLFKKAKKTAPAKTVVTEKKPAEAVAKKPTTKK